MEESKIIYNYEYKIDENGELHYMPAIYDYNTNKHYTLENLYKQNQALNNRIESQTSLNGLLILVICIYIIYRTHKTNKIELSSKSSVTPPIRTLIFGLILIGLEIISIVYSGGTIEFGEINSLLDVIKLLSYLIGYFILLITGIVLVVSFIKREKHYRSLNK